MPEFTKGKVSKDEMFAEEAERLASYHKTLQKAKQCYNNLTTSALSLYYNNTANRNPTLDAIMKNYIELQAVRLTCHRNPDYQYTNNWTGICGDLTRIQYEGKDIRHYIRSDRFYNDVVRLL